MPDSGWRFTAGDEDGEYMGNPDNSDIFSLNTVANNDPEIIPFLTVPYGTAFYRNENGEFIQDTLNMDARAEIDELLHEYQVINLDDFYANDSGKFDEMHKTLNEIQVHYQLSDEDIKEILLSVFGE